MVDQSASLTASPASGSAPSLMEPVGPAKAFKRRFASLRVITALILREMTTSYGRSPGGYAWVILEPVGGVLLMSVIFSMMMRNPPLGVNFALFYASGVVPFVMFMTVGNAVANSLTYSRQLLAYPSVTWVDALFARFILNFLTQVMVFYIVIGGIMMIYETRVILDIPTMALSCLLCGLLALGIGTLNCFLFTQFQVWQRVWSILTRPLVFISGVMILHGAVPQPYRDFLSWNPLIHVIGLMRRGIYVSYSADYVSVAYVLLVSTGCLLIGLIFLRRYQRDLLNQ